MAKAKPVKGAKKGRTTAKSAGAAKARRKPAKARKPAPKARPLGLRANVST